MLLSIVLPRPIALVSSLNSDHSVNLAPFSLFNLVSLDPPIAFVSVQKTIPPKRTSENIKRVREFVINIPNYEMAEGMNKAATPCAGTSNKFEHCGFNPEEAKIIMTAGIAEAKIRLECVLHGSMEFDGYEMFLGKVVSIYCADRVVENDTVSIAKHEFIGRLGPKELYLKVVEQNVFKMLREAEHE